MTQRKILPSALINEGRIVVEGESNEKLPPEKVYVSPSTERSYDGRQGAKLGQLPSDAIEMDRSTWGRRPWIRKEEGKSNPSNPIFSGQWYEHVEGTQKLREELIEMNQAYPMMALYLDENNQMLWKGYIEKLGDVEIRFPDEYPDTRFNMSLMNQVESFTEKVNKNIKGRKVSPAAGIHIALKLLNQKE